MDRPLRLALTRVLAGLLRQQRDSPEARLSSIREPRKGAGGCGAAGLIRYAGPGSRYGAGRGGTGHGREIICSMCRYGVIRVEWGGVGWWV